MPAAQRRLAGEPKARLDLFSQAAYMLGLVCHIGDSSVAGNKLRSSRWLEFPAVLVLLVPCTNQSTISRFLKDILACPPPQGASG